MALSSERYGFPFLGKSAVGKLTLSGFLCLNNFEGFTTLTNLHCAVSTYQLQHLNLSECHSLRTACLLVDWYPASGMYTTLITGSRSLEKLTCNGLSSLLKFDVSLCSLLMAQSPRISQSLGFSQTAELERHSLSCLQQQSNSSNSSMNDNFSIHIQVLYVASCTLCET